MDEALPVARAVGVEAQYRKIAETGEMDFRQIEKYLKRLNGRQEVWVAEQINKAEPFAGSREAINYLKEMGYETVIVTDDALMSLPECNHIVRKRLGVNKIIPTAEIEINGGEIVGRLKSKRTKPQILEELFVQCKPSKMLCMAQGPNDIGMAEYAREKGGTVISVNSPKLESVSHYHIETIAEAPELLEEIFAGK